MFLNFRKIEPTVSYKLLLIKNTCASRVLESSALELNLRRSLILPPKLTAFSYSSKELSPGMEAMKTPSRKVMKISRKKAAGLIISDMVKWSKDKESCDNRSSTMEV